MNHTQIKQLRHQAFTLVELVVVILIMGIIAAVAAPRMFERANEARESATRQSLQTIRSALDLYKADNSSYPTAATIVTDLQPYLRGAWPAPEVGSNAGNPNVVATAEAPITTAVAGNGEGWIYNESEGLFAVNDQNYIQKW